MYIHRDCGLYFVPSKLTLHVRISELALNFNIKGSRASPNVRSVLGPGPGPAERGSQTRVCPQARGIQPHTPK